MKSSEKVVSYLLDSQFQIEDLLRRWIEEAGALPQDGPMDDLFAPKFYRSNIIDFFTAVLSHIGNPKFRERVVDAAEPEMNCTEAWRTMNGPGHPVRDGLILLGYGLFES